MAEDARLTAIRLAERIDKWSEDDKGGYDQAIGLLCEARDWLASHARAVEGQRQQHERCREQVLDLIETLNMTRSDVSRLTSLNTDQREKIEAALSAKDHQLQQEKDRAEVLQQGFDAARAMLHRSGLNLVIDANDRARKAEAESAAKDQQIAHLQEQLDRRVGDALNEAVRVTKPLSDKELAAERIPTGLLEMRLDAKGMDQRETFNWLVERSNRLAECETALGEARQQLAALRQLLTCSVNGTHYCPNCDRSLNPAAALAASRAPQGETTT